MAESRRPVLESDPGNEASADASGFETAMPQPPGVRWLTEEQTRAIFDNEARQVMGMSGEEFLRRYDAGEFIDIPDDIEHLDYWDLVLSIPFGR